MATGNPRNKCALQPGHSLMDWIRLGNTAGIDLAGNRGQPRPITLAELAQHSTPDDAWMAVHGKCYNVTRYMAFHPGGRDELMRGVGRDATKLFDEVHAWVNYEQMLAKCYLGPLRAPGNFAGGANGSSAAGGGGGAAGGLMKPPATANSLMTGDFKLPLQPLAPASTHTSPTRSGLAIAAERARRSGSIDTKCASLPASPTGDGPPLQISVLEAAEAAATGGVAESATSASSVCVEPEIVPRFDWMQKTDVLQLVFYTRALCNPGWSVEMVGEERDAGGLAIGKRITVRVFTQRSVHVFEFVCAHAVQWPCTSRVSYDTGKIELTLRKVQPALWTSFGLLDRRKVTDLTDISAFEYDVAECRPTTHDSFAVLLRPRRRVLQHVPIGYHLRIGRRRPDGAEVERSYTPVPVAFMRGERNGAELQMDADVVPLLVKRYDGGALSERLTQDAVDGQRVDPLRLSQPRGAFSLYRTRLHTRVAMLAAGSGLTPMLSVLEYMLERTSNRMESITLLYFNKTAEDIWCRTYLQQLAAKDARLHVRHYLSGQPVPADWPPQHTGRITPVIVAPLAAKTSPLHATYAFLCGPPAFNEIGKQLLAKVGLDESRVHVFH